MTQIELSHIDKHFGDVHVINDVDLTVESNEFVVFLGQSGCGKTTTLRAIAGLETIDSGAIRIDGVEVQNTMASDRDIAFVFQSFALYPHMTVFENIAFPLRAVGERRATIDREVRRVAEVLRIAPLLPRRPSALSGGDMQRVAIARALVRSPKALLMDEPIGALDAKLREEMRVEIKRLHIEQGSTSIYVTHDQLEAMSLADRIVVMHDGILQQVGMPDEIYEAPANLFVAQFVGSPVMNVAEIEVRERDGRGAVSLPGAAEPFVFPPALMGQLDAGRANGSLAMGVRPENVDVATEPAPDHVPAEVQVVEPLGSHDIVDLAIGSETLRARTRPGLIERPGTRVWAGLDTARTHFFDTASGRSLGVRV